MTHRPLFEACVDAAPGPEAARPGASGMTPGAVLFEARETRAKIVAGLIPVLAGFVPAAAHSLSGARPAHSIGTSR